MGKLFFFIVAYVILPTPAIAGNASYECTVERVWQGRDGSMGESPLASLTVGRVFTIGRDDGRIVSDFLPYPDLEVVWRGSAKQPFVARTRLAKSGKKGYADWPNIQFLKVEEFREGAAKPFVLVDVADVKTGGCK